MNSVLSEFTQSRRRLAVTLIVLAVGLAGLLLLRFFDPATHGFYPKCILHEWTGMKCPGCGTTRALAALTHGDWRAAFGYNPMLFALLPYFAAVLVRPSLVLRRGLAWGAFVVLVAYWILRNVCGW